MFDAQSLARAVQTQLDALSAQGALAPWKVARQPVQQRGAQLTELGGRDAHLRQARHVVQLGVVWNQ